MRAMRIVAIPEAIIDIRMTSPASDDEPPMEVTRTTTKTHPTEITETCCRARSSVTVRGGTSFTP